MNLLPSLRYLVALHEHQHFGRAALACHITQPALSNALRALESEFGVVIIRRDRAYAGFTPEGERVLTMARLMLHEYAVLQDDLKSRFDAPQGTLRLGAVPTAMPIAARFAAQLKARHPGIVAGGSVVHVHGTGAGAGRPHAGSGPGIPRPTRLERLAFESLAPVHRALLFTEAFKQARPGRLADGAKHDLARGRSASPVSADAGHAQPPDCQRRVCVRRGARFNRPWKPIPF